MAEQFCDWHVIVVEGSDDEREISVMHPGCAFTVTVGFDDAAFANGFEYACVIQNEIDNAGYDTLLEGITEPGMYRARMRHYSVRSFEFSEIETDYEVERLVVFQAGTGT